jgi:uncharacterized protein YecE (DUF72 family)
MRAFIGTSGFSYPAWKGSFYPDKLPGKKMLAYYAERFATVESNNTFYRLPTEKALADWTTQVPPGFRFALKASQKITHQARLKEEAQPALEALVRAAAALGDHLGPFLFQLPPNFKADLPRLEAFLARLPAGPRCAFEFRHASWFDDAVYAALQKAGAALCIAEAPELATPLQATAGWGYLRLRREDYVAADLDAWAERIGQQPWDEAYVYFKHEDSGTGPRLAAALQERLQPAERAE